jgi:hypothetical protein
MKTFMLSVAVFLCFTSGIQSTMFEGWNWQFKQGRVAGEYYYHHSMTWIGADGKEYIEVTIRCSRDYAYDCFIISGDTLELLDGIMSRNSDTEADPEYDDYVITGWR